MKKALRQSDYKTLKSTISQVRIDDTPCESSILTWDIVDCRKYSWLRNAKVI